MSENFTLSTTPYLALLLIIDFIEHFCCAESGLIIAYWYQLIQKKSPKQFFT
jgi:hypothetical protein